MSNSEIFISYAWGGESEKMADDIYTVLIKDGFDVVRDKINLGYKGHIKEFMQRIGAGSAIVVIISDKYLRSPNCMYEIVQIQQNGQLFNRIFPIVLSDANIYRPQNRLMYAEHWEKEVRTLNSSMKGIQNMALIAEIQEELLEYNQILNAISGITTLLKNTNTLTPEMLCDVAYKPLIEAIKGQITKEATLQNEKNAELKVDKNSKENNLNVQGSDGGIFLQDINGSNIQITVNQPPSNSINQQKTMDKTLLTDILIKNEFAFFEEMEKHLSQLSDSIKIEYQTLKAERLHPANNFNPIDWKNRMLVFVRALK